jgi:hypothetical protein
LRAFAFDPSLNVQLDTAVINQVTLKIPWEDALEIGPVGEYLEIVDVDPASNACYAPVDLNHPYLLAQDGLSPSEGNPQFHQQMVYAIAMTTIQNFEQALGRRALWSPRIYQNKNGRYRDEFIRRLRIYPHALREANAYYSPEKKALLFGYFPAVATDPGANLPGGIVFTCLSHDIIAHETTHALLDGLHRRFIEPSNVDILALHEAFADIVALFQHFSFPDVLHHQIARTRGDLTNQNHLAQLAQQFGQALGSHGALRDALGEVDPETGVWKPKKADPGEIHRIYEPHTRGALLVAAVFDAFLTVYKARIADLLRIATGGSGVLPPGEIHPDLVRRLAGEAAKTSGHFLRICIRALDYCPPIDVTFGDYLRALITADADLIPDDPWGYRIAIIESFHQRGIYPLDVRNLSEESLKWRPARSPKEVKLLNDSLSVINTFKEIEDLRLQWKPDSDREWIFRQSERIQAKLHDWFSTAAAPEVATALGLTLQKDAPPSIYRRKGLPSFEIHSVRPAFRTGPSGNTITDLVINITQRRRGYLDQKLQDQIDAGEVKSVDPPDFIFRGGCTLLASLETGEVRYCISKRVTASGRLERQRRFLGREYSPSLQATYFGDSRKNYFEGLADYPVEPFALLHRVMGIEESLDV